MTAGSPSHWVSSVSRIAPEDIYIRGYAMQDLVGKLPFSAISYLLIRGELPTPGQARMMDVILSSILDYALHKSGTIAARSVVSVNPQMTAGLSAAMLGAGEHALSPRDTGHFIARTFAQWQESGRSMPEEATNLVAELRTQKRRIPGLGHPVFKGVDPRAEKLKAIAQEAGVWGPANDWYCAVHEAFKAAAGKPDLVMNDVGMLAGIMIQMGFTPDEMCGLALLSTFPGLIAHVSEELQSGVRNRIIPDSNASYDDVQHDLVKDMAARGWS